MNEARRHEGAAGNLGSCRRIPHTDPRVTRVVKNDAPADEPVTTFFEDVDERPQVILPGTAVVVGEGQDVAARLRKAHVAGAGQPRHGSPQAPHRKRSVSGESIEEKGCRIRGRVVDDNEFPTARGRVERGHTGQEVGQPCRPVSRAHDQRHSQRHDLAWQQDAEGYRGRISRFLDIAARHHIRPLFVLFDSCWDPDPKVGRQQAPRPGVHNSGWLQSPGAKALQDSKEYPRLKAYVTGVVTAFGKDSRVLGWDIWNEPDNTNSNSYGSGEPKNKVALVLALLPQAFEWAREAGAEQPLTSGVWKGDWSSDDKLSPMERIQLESSDVISFHNYDNAAEFEKRITWLQRFHRPILCTRVHGARKREHVPGLAAGRSEVQGCGHQLGLRRGKNADVSPLGLVAETIRRSRADRLVPRSLQAGWHAVPAGRSGSDYVS